MVSSFVLRDSLRSVPAFLRHTTLSFLPRFTLASVALRPYWVTTAKSLSSIFFIPSLLSVETTIFWPVTLSSVLRAGLSACSLGICKCCCHSGIHCPHPRLVVASHLNLSPLLLSSLAGTTTAPPSFLRTIPAGRIYLITILVTLLEHYIEKSIIKSRVWRCDC